MFTNEVRNKIYWEFSNHFCLINIAKEEWVFESGTYLNGFIIFQSFILMTTSGGSAGYFMLTQMHMVERADKQQDSWWYFDISHASALSTLVTNRFIDCISFWQISLLSKSTVKVLDFQLSINHVYLVRADAIINHSNQKWISWSHIVNLLFFLFFF